jgi:hypothetical protein
MLDVRCPHCPYPDEPCTTLKPSCDRMGDPEFRERYMNHRIAMRAARAALGDAPMPPLDLTDPSDEPPRVPIKKGCC